MKKYIFTLLLLTGIMTAYAQKYSATIAIDNVDVTKLKPGDQVSVPIRLIEKSGGQISEIQFFIEFDHAVFSWNGTFEQAQSGIKKCHPSMPWDGKTWFINDNGNQIVVLWDEPNFKGVEIKREKFFVNCFYFQGHCIC